MAFPLERIADISEIRFSVLYYFIIYAKSLFVKRPFVIGKGEIVAEGRGPDSMNTVNGRQKISFIPPKQLQTAFVFVPLQTNAVGNCKTGFS